MSQYKYDPRLSQYKDSETGKIVSKAKILELLDSEKARLETRLGLLTNQLEKGTITVASWQKEFYTELKHSHIRMGLLASGGTNVPHSKKLYGTIGQNLRSQQEFLVKFRRDIQKGKYTDNSEKMKWRARLYADSIRESFNDGERIARNAEGYTKAKRILSAGSNHCPECLQLASKGWTSLDKIIPLKSPLCSCKWNCRCYCIYKRDYLPIFK